MDPNSDMLFEAMRDGSVPFRSLADGSTAGESTGRAIRGILVGVTAGKFRGDSRRDAVETGCFNAGDAFTGVSLLMACNEPLPLGCADGRELSEGWAFGVEGGAESLPGLSEIERVCY